jgi:hypothetical protein
MNEESFFSKQKTLQVLKHLALNKGVNCSITEFINFNFSSPKRGKQFIKLAEEKGLVETYSIRRKGHFIKITEKGYGLVQHLLKKRKITQTYTLYRLEPAILNNALEKGIPIDLLIGKGQQVTKEFV